MTQPAATAPQIVWLASYPKSGNTWLRFLVCNLVFGIQDSAAALNHLAPDIHESPGLRPPAAPLLVKTHYPYSPQLPLGAHTAAALYIVRNPMDVMLSAFHYAQRSLSELPPGASHPQDARAALERYVEQFIASRGAPRWINLGIGSWDDHVRSWLQVQRSFPLLLLRYEDLIGDATAAAGRICTFLGLRRSPQELQAAIDGASFRRMKEIEEADIRGEKVGIFFKPYLRPSIQAGLRFLRSGRAGEAVEVLSEPLRRRARAAFGGVMQELGYEPATGADGQPPSTQTPHAASR